MKLVDTGTGQVFEPAYTKETRWGVQWWTKGQLKKDGTPSLRNRGQWVGDFYAVYDEAQEARATPIRERIAQLQGEMTRLGLALKAVYEKPHEPPA